MSTGIAVDRQLIIVLADGTSIFDWQDGIGIDLMNNDFRKFGENEYSHAIVDEELEVLKRAGRVVSFNQRYVFLQSLPEIPHETSG